jgi:hypothetical protein
LLLAGLDVLIEYRNFAHFAADRLDHCTLLFYRRSPSYSFSRNYLKAG